LKEGLNGPRLAELLMHCLHDCLCTWPARCHVLLATVFSLGPCVTAFFLLSIAAASRFWPHSACSLCTLDRAQHDRDVHGHTHRSMHSGCSYTMCQRLYTKLCRLHCAALCFPMCIECLAQILPAVTRCVGTLLLVGMRCCVVNRTWRSSCMGASSQ
jgi:hypothetical protein